MTERESGDIGHRVDGDLRISHGPDAAGQVVSEGPARVAVSGLVQISATASISTRTSGR